MLTPITLILKSERVVCINEEILALPAKTVLTGELSLCSSDGPWGVREYENPNYVSSCFYFELAGRRLKHCGLLSAWQLWAPNGTVVRFEDREFVSACGVIDGMMDSR